MTGKPTESDQALRQRAEEKLRAHQPVDPETLSPEETKQLLHELRVHQIELEIQNEELKRTQNELECSRARYFDLYDLAPVGYMTLSEKGLIQEANLAAATMFGVARGALVKQRISRILLKEDQEIYYQHRKPLLETGEPQTCELRMLKADGTAFWAHLAASAEQDPSASSGQALAVNPGQCGEPAPVIRVVLSDISERKQSEEALKASLAEKVVLLREVHHRVKNNLSIIIGLLVLQRDEIADEAALSSFKELSDRIMSMALVHERLYRSENMSRINSQNYLGDLTSHLLKSFGVEPYIRCIVEATGVEIDLDTAIPIGLIVNELITNAIKHAFPTVKPRQGSEKCEILVTMQAGGNNFTLTVADNGVGLPPDLEWRSTSSLGLQLVRMLGEHQLGGQIQLGQAEGTRFILRFNNRRKEHGGR